MKIRTCLIEEPLNVMRLIRLRQRYEIVEEKVQPQHYYIEVQNYLRLSIQILLTMEIYLNYISSGLSYKLLELNGYCTLHLN